MNLRKLAAFFCLIVVMWPKPCAAELLPGDIALTRLRSDAAALMALRPIPEGEVIRFTNDDWIDGSFNGSGNPLFPFLMRGDGGILTKGEKVNS